MATKQYWERDKWRANERTMSQHRRVLDEVGDNRKYPFTGMFHLANLKMVQHNGGFQVLFWDGSGRYTPEEYARIVNEFLHYSTGHSADVTKRDGKASISFHIASKRDAFRLARKYGSHSVWDWLNNEEISAERKRRT